MLKIDAKIADQVLVTFIRAEGGLQTQERINGRQAFLSTRSKLRGRAGDRCRVIVASENPRQTNYYVHVTEILKSGEDRTSLLQKALNAVHLGFIRGNAEIEAKVVDGLFKQFGDDKEGLLELLLDMLDSQTYPEFTRIPPTYGHYCRAINKLIDEVAGDYKIARVLYFTRAAESCMEREKAHHWAENFADAAVSNATNCPTLELVALKTRDKLNKKRRAPDSKTKRRLLDLTECYKAKFGEVRRNINVRRRIELAQDLLYEDTRGNAPEVSQLLQLAQEDARKEENAPYFKLFCYLLSTAFYALGYKRSAAWWYAQGGNPEADPDALDEIAAGILMFGYR